MNTKSKATSCKQVAEEALFQLDCGREFADWMLALMVAIRDDQKHSRGQNTPGLSNLGVYLAETHLSEAEQALEVINGNFAALGGAQ
ncbi:hypothetical protein [Pseudomonas sp. YL2]|uniref:hypothetical protein n=1 Tax=Pseudomonas sp. YL2 TaxID=2904251 RepID=UPI001FF14953|nr:hypothetical protein [Pseudomonas sp. YL2]